MVDLLLATEIPDPNIGDKEGNTPLIYAVSAGKHLLSEPALFGDCPSLVPTCIIAY